MSNGKNVVQVVNVIDPRIQAPNPPTFTVVSGPQQLNHYPLPASGLSDTSITFSNFAPLGENRAYSDTFEIETQFRVTFTSVAGAQAVAGAECFPDFSKVLWEMFPLSSVTDQIRVNINGCAFNSRPQATLRARARYWNQEELEEAYLTSCPVTKPLSGEEYPPGTSNRAAGSTYTRVVDYSHLNQYAKSGLTRLAPVDQGYYGDKTALLHTSELYNSNRFRIEKLEELPQTTSGTQPVVAANMPLTTTFLVSVREPLLCPPFSMRLDKTFGRALIGITSLDVSYSLGNLRNAILSADPNIANVTVNIAAAMMHYDVMTIPDMPLVTEPLHYPYRNIVPYVTRGPSDVTIANPVLDRPVKTNIVSGNYSLNEIPAAIWVFVSEDLGSLQGDHWAPIVAGSTNLVNTSNHLFAVINRVNISMGNTTAILNNASKYDLFRMCKANGLEDTFDNFAGTRDFIRWITNGANTTGTAPPVPVGSCLRLVPGQDIITPDIPLVPGSAGNNLVFKVDVEYEWRANDAKQHTPALWVLFEYTGDVAIAPGMCAINTAPLTSVMVEAAPRLMELPSTGLEDSTVVSRIAVGGTPLSAETLLSSVQPLAAGATYRSAMTRAVPDAGLGESQAGPESLSVVRGAGVKRARKCGGAITTFNDLL